MMSPVDFIRQLAGFKTIRGLIRAAESWKYLDSRVWDHEAGNVAIYDAIISRRPVAIGKLGSTELQGIRSYLRERENADWRELTRNYRRSLYTNSGLFPDDPEIFEQYCRFMTNEVLPQLTHAIVWLTYGEHRVLSRFCRDYTPINIMGSAPYLWSLPWSIALEGKKVLVVHPFEKSIRKQHDQLAHVWGKKKAVMPVFGLDVLAVPHYPSLVRPKHHDWFESLAMLKKQMEEKDFDVALIGAGAYSLPLAIHAKGLGRQGIHTGGETQFLFGIKGARWDAIPNCNRYYNEHWIRPLPEDTPASNNSIEGGCYW
jgi:hypothetical protein